MKRFLFIICASTTLALVLLIIFHKAINNNSSQFLVNQLAKAGESLDQVKTHLVTLEGFNRAILERAGTNLDSLSESERAKLLSCINNFYSCYSSGHFDDYKQFRLRPPFTVNKDIVSFVKEKFTSNDIDLKSDQDILRAAWNFFNGTNKIGQIDEESIRLSVVTKSDMGLELRQASDASKWPAIAAATCLENTVLYQPTLADLLEKERSVRYFTLEVKARFNSVADGPAIPIVLVGYWDPTREDWMPYCLCFWISASQYHTFF
jgi:hypothetical protein